MTCATGVVESAVPRQSGTRGLDVLLLEDGYVGLGVGEALRAIFAESA